MIKKMKPKSKSLLLKEDIIKYFHRVITVGYDGAKNIADCYRNHIVKVGNKEHGGVYTPPKILDDIKILVAKFVKWINSRDVLEQDTLIRAALAHYYLALIHPFSNGNGRTARDIEAILLKSVGIKFMPHMLSNYYYCNMDEYFWAFSLSERNKAYDITPFLEFFLKGVVASLEEIKTTIFSWIRKFTLRDYYIYLFNNKHINQRQFDLLVLLIEFDEEFSIRDLIDKDKFRIIYRKVSERTIRRDLKVLESKNLLQPCKKDRFQLNPKVLDINI